jgi:hypothetical protein
MPRSKAHCNKLTSGEVRETDVFVPAIVFKVASASFS